MTKKLLSLLTNTELQSVLSQCPKIKGTKIVVGLSGGLFYF